MDLQPTSPPLRSLYVLCLAVAGCLLLLCAPSFATEHLTNASQADALCALSTPISTPKQSELPSYTLSTPPSTSRSYQKRRQTQLAQLYSVDITADAFDIASYDTTTNLLALVPKKTFALFGGTHTLVFQQPPLLVFEVSPEEADEIQTLFKTKNIHLRIEFGLAALSDPTQPFCASSKKGPTAIQAIWISTSLIGTPSVYAKPKVFTHHQNDDAAQIKQAFTDSSDPSRPRRPRVHVAHLRGLGTSLTSAQTQNLAQDTETLAFACFTKSLCDAGPHKGALVVETFFDSKGNLRDVNIVVDATGSAKLSSCVASQLERLPPQPKAADKGVRMSIYLDRW